MIILRQREYGLIGKWALRRSNKLMNRISEINSSIAKYEDIPKTKEERQVTSKLFKYAKKTGMKRFHIGGDMSMRPEITSPEELDAYKSSLNFYRSKPKHIHKQKTQRELSHDRKLSSMISTVERGGKVISVHGKKSPVAAIAHEIGHNTGNPEKGNLFHLPEIIYPGGKNNFENTSRLRALGLSMRNFLGKTPRVKEERRATREGLKLLKSKSIRASKGLQRDSRKYLKDCLKTYKLGREADLLRPIAAFADRSIIGDTAGKINSQLSQNTAKAINTVYRKGGRF